MAELKKGMKIRLINADKYKTVDVGTVGVVETNPEDDLMAMLMSIEYGADIVIVEVAKADAVIKEGSDGNELTTPTGLFSTAWFVSDVEIVEEIGEPASEVLQ